MTTNLNIAPYFDDFNPDGNYHRILFKPGYAVQSRELTQIQSVLQEQIRKFGNHVFQQGSIVIPGNSFIDDQACFVKVESQISGVPINTQLFEGKTIESIATGVRAVIRKIILADGTDPITFYVSYIGGGGASNVNIFTDSDTLRIVGNTGVTVLTKSVGATGFGTLAFVNKGVYYVNGFFVVVDTQSTVVSKYTQTASASILLKITESIATSEDDETLLDPAQGSYNYAAPGADRLKISLDLTTLPLDATISNDYVEIMRVVDGTLQYHSRFPKYNELEKSLARRTSDEAGDFVVSGFDFDVREHKNVGHNNGMYTDGDIDKVVYNVTAGKAYIEGFEVESIFNSDIVVDKARTVDHIKNTNGVAFRPSYGQYIFVSDLKRLPNFNAHESIELWNTSDATDSSATLVGHARVLGLDYIRGDIDSGNGIFALYIYELSMVGSNSIDLNVGGVRFSTGAGTVLQNIKIPATQSLMTVGEIVNSGTYSAKLRFHDLANGEAYIYKHDHTKLIPLYGQTIVGATSSVSAVIKEKTAVTTISTNNSALFYIPVPNIKELRTTENTIDIAYTTWQKLVIVTNSSGAGSVSITEGTIANLEQSNIYGTTSAGVVTFNKFSLSSGGTTLSVTGGPVSSTIDVFVNVNKKQLQERAKTLTSYTQLGVTPANTITLTKCDIYDIVSIISSTDGNVTSRFLLDNGQRDYVYGVGSLTLQSSMPGGTLTINYRYFEHSSSGDYFSVDSYKTLGTDYLNLIPEYISQYNAQVIPLKFAMDCRKIITDGASLVLPTSLVTTSAKYYLPRVDILTLNKSGVVRVISGTPSEKPSIPNTPKGDILLRTITVPAYTPNIRKIRNLVSKNRRFTMENINELNSRVDHVEEMSLLNSLERDLIAMEIVDAGTGLNRYKSGYLVDNFKNPYTISDVYSPFFSAEYDKQTLRPSREPHEVLLSVDPSATNYVTTGNLVTLPYIERALATQPVSTRVVNLNPFLVFSWEGNMTISPAIDTWVEREDLPDVFKTVTNTVVINRVEYDYVSIPVNPMDQTLGTANRDGTFTWAPGVNMTQVNSLISSGQLVIPAWQPPEGAQFGSTISPLRDGGINGSPTIISGRVIQGIVNNISAVNQVRTVAGTPLVQNDWSSINTN